jgi:hypothetical protein
MITVRLRLRGSTLVVEIQDDRRAPKLVVPRGLGGKPSGVETLPRGKQLVVLGSYDDAVRRAAEEASREVAVIPDTALHGFEPEPGWVVEGYSTVFWNSMCMNRNSGLALNTSRIVSFSGSSLKC